VSVAEPRRLAFAATSLLLGLLMAAALVDLLVYSQDLDLAAIRRVLYYQSVELPLHKPEPRSTLHYRLQPDQHFGLATISSSGLRNPVPSPTADGPRILFAGGSTIFGVRVRDEETLPARLQHHLGDNAAVWNLGVSAYVEAQVLEISRQWLDRIEGIDLILIMITNPGRRPFLGGEPLSRSELRWQLQNDPGFADENLPSTWDWSEPMHATLLSTSAVWRYITAVRASQLQQNDLRWDPTQARERAQEALREAAASAGARVIYVAYPRHGFPCPGCWRGDGTVSLERPGLTAAEHDLHPAAAVLDAHAAVLAERLRAGGLLSTNR
jgi:hypothetical protein